MTTPIKRENNYVNRFFGGPPLSVIFRLVLLSILIGVILQVLGLEPETACAARVGHGLRCTALAVALSPPRRRRGGAHLYYRSAHAGGQRPLSVRADGLTAGDERT